MRYIYYRIHRGYSFFGDETPVVMATGLMTAVYALHILTFYTILVDYFDYRIELNKYVSAVVIAITYFLTEKAFAGKYSGYEKRWKKGPQGKYLFKGLLVFIYVIVSIILPFLIMKHG